MNSKHRSPGHIGRFTVHSPEDYRPRHRGHEHGPMCNPGNCEREHYLQTGIFDEVSA